MENIKLAVTELTKEKRQINEEMSEILNTVGKEASFIEHMGEIDIELGNVEQKLQIEVNELRRTNNEYIDRINKLEDRCKKSSMEYNNVVRKSGEIVSEVRNLLHQIESSTEYETEYAIGWWFTSKTVIKQDEEGKPMKILKWNRYLDAAINNVESEINGS
jgi:DNA repair ATPase RecN